jgi:hypothetical protein
MGVGEVVGIAGSLLGGFGQKKAAKNAAAAQTAMGNRQMDLQERVYNEQTQRFAPFLGSGTNALRAYEYEMGLGAKPNFGGTMPTVESYFEQAAPGTKAPGSSFAAWQRQIGVGRQPSKTAATPQTQRFRVNGQSFGTREEAEAFARANAKGGTEYQGYRASPGYQWQMDQGTSAIDASAAARGGLMSGRTLQDLRTFGQGLADQDREQYMSRLAGMTDMGMGAAGAQATAGNNFAAGSGNALANIGNAQAAGAIGQGNALSGMFNNLSQTLGYMTKPKVPGAS